MSINTYGHRKPTDQLNSRRHKRLCVFTVASSALAVQAVSATVTIPGAGVKVGVLSLTSVRVMVTEAVTDLAVVPPSMALTTTTKCLTPDAPSRSRVVAVDTTPDAESTRNRPGVEVAAFAENESKERTSKVHSLTQGH
jgi:hypothetical protein